MKIAITYSNLPGDKIAVFVEGRRRGSIEPYRGGFRYHLGASAGEVFSSVAEVKASLEAE